MLRTPSRGDNTRPLGFVLYEGPSLIDGGPVALVLTGVRNYSANAKTGPMLQTWVVRSDVNPLSALAAGLDASACGSCKFRGTLGKNRACYVVAAQAPQQVFHSYERGDYLKPTAALLTRWVRGRFVRCGSYGDPTAVPLPVWTSLLKYTDGGAEPDRRVRRVVSRRRKGHTGYTQRWAECDPGFKAFLMASVASEDEYAAAKRLGWRTYRVRGDDAPTLAGEVVCPSSAEGRFKTDCYGCRLCDGGGDGPDVTIKLHGSRPTLANGRRALALVTLG